MKRSTTKEFIEKARKIHNDKYDYSQVVYKKAICKVKIICPIHGVFQQTPHDHLGNKGCKLCGIVKRAKTQSNGIDRFINRAKSVHGDEYDYSLVEYTNGKSKVDIICKVYGHGQFKQTPDKHLQGQGCPKCRYVKSKISNTGTTQGFIQKAKLLHDKYDYSLVDYVSIHTKIKIICPKHGIFEQSPDSHLHGSGCAKCSCGTSKAELDIIDFIESYGITVTHRSRSVIFPYELDIYIPSKKLAIEYCGLYWHTENTKHKHYHFEKYKRCNEQGIELITLFEDEWEQRRDRVERTILYKLGLSNKGIFARKLQIKECDDTTAKKFLNEYHLLGYVSSKVNLAAYDDIGNIVGLMSFGHTTRQSKYQWELKRFVTDGRSHPGLASKLFKHFITHYDVDNIVTFADLRWFSGEVYEKLGFVYDGFVNVDYQYVIGNSRKHKSSFRKQRISKKFGLNIQGKTEKELMETLGYKRIWDCGKKRFIYHNGK